MGFEHNKSNWAKILIIVVLLIIAPYSVPFAFEFILVADFFGLEALILFLLYQFRGAWVGLRHNLSEFGAHMIATFVLLADCYLFQPKTYLSHTAGSSLIFAITCSVAFALALWIPAIYLSSGLLT